MMRNLESVNQMVEMLQMAALTENPMGDPRGDLGNILLYIKKNNTSHKKKETILLKLEARSSCCFFVIVSLLLLMVVVIADQKMNMKCT
jgi:hypothetical protein